MTIPLPPGAAAELLDRAATGAPGEVDAWIARAQRVGFCANPVRLVGHAAQADRATGEVRATYIPSQEDGGVLLVACGDRRASRCPACAEVYRRDAWQLIASGLRGGKGVPSSVAGHPVVFATFTAPSFGAVHSRRVRGDRVEVCQPRGDGRRCRHGRRLGCWVRHGEEDPRLGTPVCRGCWDAEGQVVWNALAPKLWARTTIMIRRALARSVGLSERACRALVRIRYVKVAEVQKRGAVHFHALIRLDGAPPEGDPGRLVAPPEGFTVGLLASAVGVGAARASVPLPMPADHVGPVPVVRWGAQLDVRPVSMDTPDVRDNAGVGLEVGEESATVAELDARVAGYLAKYATKGAEVLKLPDRRIRGRDAPALGGLALPGHVEQLVRSAWTLGGLPHLAGLRLRAWAHALGFSGHFTTKSRRFSVTFGRLRRARAEYARRAGAGGRVPLDAWGRPETDGAVVPVGFWAYEGRGYPVAAPAVLARLAADQARADGAF